MAGTPPRSAADPSQPILKTHIAFSEKNSLKRKEKKKKKKSSSPRNGVKVKQQGREKQPNL
jgi:hypothetical protein